MGALSCCHKKVLWKQHTQFIRQCRNDLIQHTQSTVLFVRSLVKWGHSTKILQHP
jgi:hypothetical protein